MEDADQSSSENNIEVLGINDFPQSPHQINKKAYSLKLLFEKGSPNQYRSRLGFNLYKLLVGYYTMFIEWFPPEVNFHRWVAHPRNTYIPTCTAQLVIHH